MSVTQNAIWNCEIESIITYLFIMIFCVPLLQLLVFEIKLLWFDFEHHLPLVTKQENQHIEMEFCSKQRKVRRNKQMNKQTDQETMKEAEKKERTRKGMEK